MLEEQVIGTGLDFRGMELRDAEVWESDIWGTARAIPVVGFIRPATADQPAMVAFWSPTWEDHRGSTWSISSRVPMWRVAHRVGPMRDLVALVCATIADETSLPTACAGRPMTVPPPSLPVVFAIAPLIALGERAMANELASGLDVDATTRFLEQSAHSPDAHPADQILAAHMRGDDCLALRLARETVLAHERVATPGVDPCQSPPGWDEAERYCRASIEIPLVVLADQERRALRARAPVVPTEGTDLADVPAWIDALEDVGVGQSGQPGGVWMVRSPIVAALVRAGRAAVPLLFETMEHDTRLTRSVEFFRDFVPERRVVSVADAAFQAVVAILGDDFARSVPRRGPFGRSSPESIAAVREYLAREAPGP